MFKEFQKPFLYLKRIFYNYTPAAVHVYFVHSHYAGCDCSNIHVHSAAWTKWEDGVSNKAG